MIAKKEAYEDRHEFCLLSVDEANSKACGKVWQSHLDEGQVSWSLHDDVLELIKDEPFSCEFTQKDSESSSPLNIGKRPMNWTNAYWIISENHLEGKEAGLR